MIRQHDLVASQDHSTMLEDDAAAKGFGGSQGTSFESPFSGFYNFKGIGVIDNPWPYALSAKGLSLKGQPQHPNQPPWKETCAHWAKNTPIPLNLKVLMKILVLAGWYPQYGRSGNGIFIVRHAEALVAASNGIGKEITVDLMAVQPLSWMQAPKLSQGNSGFLPDAPRVLPKEPVRHHLSIYQDGGWGALALWRQIKAWRALWAGYKALHGTPPDILVAQICWKSALIAAISGLPFVVVEHWSGWLHDRVPYAWWQRLMVAFSLRRASKVLAVSPWLAEAIRRKVADLQVEVLPNVVEEHFWTAQERVPVEESKHFLHISDLAEVKNPKLLMEAWVQSGLATQGYRLRIAGEYSAKRHEEYRDVQGIEWLGVLDSFGVAKELREARALLLPSLRETFSIVTVEALLCQCPVWLGYSPLLEQYRGHPLVKGLDVADPVAWTHALQENILYHSSISLRGTSAVLNASNSPLEQFQTHAVGEQLLKTLEGIVV
jgi:glycosyltransferase involved in cell wall biosynthesis